MAADKAVKQLATKRPRSLWEKIFGLVGGAATFTWIFQVCLKAIDAVGRVQTLMALEPYIRYLVLWWVQLIELGVAVTFIVLATRIEHSRETEDAPKIILLSTREPTPIRRDRLWIKVALAGMMVAILAALGVFLVVKHSTRTTQSVPKAGLMPKSNPVVQTDPMQAGKPSQEAKAPAANSPRKNAAPITVEDKPTAQSRLPQAPPIVIPIPDQSVTPKPVSGKSSVKYVATINGQEVQASSKIPGRIAVSLQVTNNSQYQGTISPTDFDNVAEALKKTGKIVVFSNKTAGNYQIRGNDVGYSVSLTAIHPRTIYFFDASLANTCGALKTLISSVVGQMDCKFISIQPSSDPNQPNVSYDFLMQSGLDMEIDL